MMPKVFAIIVSFNGLHWYNQCIGSLINCETPIQIIVVDNGSTDGSVEFLKQNYPEVLLIQNKENLGFAKANNIGFRYAIDHGADFVFLLNQDAWVEKNTLSVLLTSFEEKENIGIVSPIHLNGSYSALDYGFGYNVGAEFISDAFLGKMKTYYERPFINAAAWLISKDCIETVGGFDTLLFKHYGEDDNYCQRVLYHGFQVVINTRCTICHDREDRIDWERKFETISRLTPLFNERKTYGNINLSFDFKRLKSDIRKKIRRKILFGHFKSVSILKQRLVIFEMIEESRLQNMNKGLSWL